MIMPKDFDENLKDFHYVYEHKLDGKVIYVGKGTGYRAVSLIYNILSNYDIIYYNESHSNFIYLDHPKQP